MHWNDVSPGATCSYYAQGESCLAERRFFLAFLWCCFGPFPFLDALWGVFVPFGGAGFCGAGALVDLGILVTPPVVVSDSEPLFLLRVAGYMPGYTFSMAWLMALSIVEGPNTPLPWTKLANPINNFIIMTNTYGWA